MKGLLQIVAAVVLWAVAIVFTLGLALIAFAFWCLIVFPGADKRAEKARATLVTTLMPEEQIAEQTIQHRAFALFSRRILLAITNSRILTLKRGLFGGFKMLDVQWKDLRDVTIEQNVLETICGSNLQFAHSNAGVAQIAVDGVESSAASKIYARAQFEEQSWEEKRRIREIEEVRAAAGGVVVNNAPHPSEAKPVSTGNRMLEEIQKAKELLDMGAVSDAEFQEMKAKILAST